MRAINHALTGAIIGFAVAEPIAAVPVAFLSHYVCDAIPHYGANLPNSQELRSPVFRNLLYIDVVLCTGLVALLAILHPKHWLLAAVCAFAAAMPDMFSFKRYRSTLGNRPWRGNRYSRFAHTIQWFERPIGAVVEIAWAAAAIVLIVPFLR